MLPSLTCRDGTSQRVARSLSEGELPPVATGRLSGTLHRPGLHRQESPAVDQSSVIRLYPISGVDESENARLQCPVRSLET